MIVLRRSATFITVAPSPLHIRLLGGLQFSQNGKLLSGFVTTTAQALLAYLVVTGYSHSQEHLASLFWGDLSAVEAKANLRRVLLNLRKLVGIHIVLARDSVAFNPSAPYWCDVGQFEHILTQEWVSDIRSKELRPRPTHDSAVSFDPHTVRHHAPHHGHQRRDENRSDQHFDERVATAVQCVHVSQAGPSASEFRRYC